MDKTLKYEAVHVVSEMNILLPHTAAQHSDRQTQAVAVTVKAVKENGKDLIL